MLVVLVDRGFSLGLDGKGTVMKGRVTGKRLPFSFLVDSDLVFFGDFISTCWDNYHNFSYRGAPP